MHTSKLPQSDVNSQHPEEGADERVPNVKVAFPDESKETNAPLAFDPLIVTQSQGAEKTIEPFGVPPEIPTLQLPEFGAVKVIDDRDNLQFASPHPPQSSNVPCTDDTFGATGTPPTF
jgi:hypothetical protein